MPKIVNKEEKKRQILKTAIRVFAKRGFPKTKMTDIAEAASVGKGTIYEYFRSKEDLFMSAIDFYFEETEQKIVKNLKNFDDPVERLHAYFKGCSHMLSGDFLDFAEIALDLWAEGLRHNNQLSGFDISRVYQKYRQQIIRILNEGIRQNRFKNIDPTITAAVIIGSLDGLLIQWLMDRNIFNLNNICRLVMDDCWRK